jgi:hypothetical protein
MTGTTGLGWRRGAARPSSPHHPCPADARQERGERGCWGGGGDAREREGGIVSLLCLEVRIVIEGQREGEGWLTGRVWGLLRLESWFSSRAALSLSLSLSLRVRARHVCVFGGWARIGSRGWGRGMSLVFTRPSALTCHVYIWRNGV